MWLDATVDRRIRWLTPTSLFLLLNFIIGSIFLLSLLSPSKTPPHHGGGYDLAPPTLQRAPSLLDRIKSINLSAFKFDDVHQQYVDNNLERAPSILERVKSIDLNLYKYLPENPDPVYVEQPSLSRPPSFLERVKSIDFKSFYRSDSGKLNPEAVQEEPGSEIDKNSTPVYDHVVKRSESEHNHVKQRKVSDKMKKSASDKSRAKAKEEEEEVERRRPATTKIEKTTSFGDGDDQGVDAKADDFINKFKQQLKLQRLDSLLRYWDMLRSRAK
ncbi:pathogen-associated molecular patterns-induced protein A70-like [Hibiscus syriacus]|uniref:pathogen-associated molecular patterns-induced protein A70-like n=1 Tax=Hibiscus syriacus TaxID=106335 RepID=UPI001923E864|nr:pathogen-associated molecular patterns-induced protein A70-like [Hibiscus syriacus]